MNTINRIGFYMVILVDGYNVTRFLFPRDSDSHETELAFFFDRLARYRSLKKDDISDVIVVLDGGLFAHKTREIRKGVVMVHAGQGRKADDVLVEYSRQFRNGAILVSNDRELRRRVAAQTSDSVSVAEFWDLVTEVCKAQGDNGQAHQFGSVNFIKYCSVDDENDGMGACVDKILMEGSMRLVNTKDEHKKDNQQRNSNALSKKEKLVQAIRKKLG